MTYIFPPCSMNYKELLIFMQNHGESLYTFPKNFYCFWLKKKSIFKIGQRKFNLDWEQIGDVYEGFFS
jgi:hypothetical protein